MGGPWTTGPFRRPVRRAWEPGAALVGDAAGYFDPLTGQGIHRALRSAELCASAVERCLEEGTFSALADYAERWEREVEGPRRLQHAIDTVVQRPWLREPALAGLHAARLLPILTRSG